MRDKERVPTSLGAELVITKAYEHLGPGIMLTVRMLDRTDRRSAEVYLKPSELDEFIIALEQFQIM